MILHTLNCSSEKDPAFFDCLNLISSEDTLVLFAEGENLTNSTLLSLKHQELDFQFLVVENADNKQVKNTPATWITMHKFVEYCSKSEQIINWY